MFDTLEVFLKYFFEKVNIGEVISRQYLSKFHAKLPSMQKLGVKIEQFQKLPVCKYSIIEKNIFMFICFICFCRD